MSGFSGFEKGLSGVLQPQLEKRADDRRKREDEERKYWLGVATSLDEKTPDSIRQEALKQMKRLYPDKDSQSIIQRAAGFVGKIRGKIHGGQASPAGAVPPMAQGQQAPAGAATPTGTAAPAGAGAPTGAAAPVSPLGSADAQYGVDIKVPAGEAPQPGQTINGVPPRTTPKGQGAFSPVPPMGRGEAMMTAGQEANTATQRQALQAATDKAKVTEDARVGAYRTEKGIDAETANKSDEDAIKKAQSYADTLPPEEGKAFMEDVQRKRFTGQAKPPAGPKQSDIHWQDKSGEWHLGKEDAQGNKFTQDGQPVDPKDVIDVSKNGPKPEKFTGELGARITAHKIIDAPAGQYSPGEVKAAKEELKKLDAAATSITIKNQNAADQKGAPVAYDKTGEEALANQSPKVKSLVKAVANYDIKLPSGFALKSEPWSTVAALVPLYKPNWKEYNYDIAREMKRDYTNTKGNATGAKILSLNTLTQHLDTFEQAADALNAKDVQGVNRFVNMIREQTGSDKVVNFETARTAISDELATALKQSGATDITIGHWRENFKQASSKAQFKGSIGEAYNLMAGRLKPIYEAYAENIGTVDGKPDVAIVYHSSRPMFEKHGIDPDTLVSKGKASPKGEVAAKTTHFVEGNDHWDIPADKLEKFKKLHPNAQAK